MQQRRGRWNLETIFGVQEVPSDSPMRDILAGVPVERLRPLWPTLFAKYRRAGWAKELQRTIVRSSHQGTYSTVAVEGSDPFHATKVECPSGLPRHAAEGTGHLRQTVVSATLVNADSHRVCPLAVEEGRNQDGHEQQAGEVNAAKRLSARVRQAHPQLPLVVLGDALYCQEPFLCQWRAERLHYVLVRQPTSPPELYKWGEAIETLGGGEPGQWHEGPACRRRFFPDRVARSVPWTASHRVGGRSWRWGNATVRASRGITTLGVPTSRSTRTMWGRSSRVGGHGGRSSMSSLMSTQTRAMSWSTTMVMGSTPDRWCFPCSTCWPLWPIGFWSAGTVCLSGVWRRRRVVSCGPPYGRLGG